jgi:hypothetical protein
LLSPRPPAPAAAPPEGLSIRSFDWHGDVGSLHVQVSNPHGEPATLYHRRRAASAAGPWSALTLAPGETYRFNLAKATPDEVGPDVALPDGVRSNLHEVFDRAHYPTVSVEEAGVSLGDVTPPMPLVQIQPPLLRVLSAAAPPSSPAEGA